MDEEMAKSLKRWLLSYELNVSLAWSRGYAKGKAEAVAAERERIKQLKDNSNKKAGDIEYE